MDYIYQRNYYGKYVVNILHSTVICVYLISSNKSYFSIIISWFQVTSLIYRLLSQDESAQLNSVL